MPTFYISVFFGGESGRIKQWISVCDRALKGSFLQILAVQATLGGESATQRQPLRTVLQISGLWGGFLFLN